MAWEYLESDHMDERFRVAVAELTRLGVNWPKAFVLDLNCGFSARLLNALPAVRAYIGNDIAFESCFCRSIDRYVGEVTELLAMSDVDIPGYLKKLNMLPGMPSVYRSPTVLACFGFSTGDNLLSDTLEATYRGFLAKLPPFAVLGKPVRWLKPPWEEMAAWPEWAAYNCIDIDVHFQAPEHLEWRRVRVAKRR